ncbi:MAG: ABC-F type ribosomal protection protein [Oscillospiraceae bacterium]|nr:ABC-F type ribosomal protection protein [Oscillospiraceae bacterium]
MIINCENIKYSVGANEILTDISFGVESGVKAGIIGANGAGKTTLLKIITGEISPESGSISTAKNASIGILRQEPALNENDSLYDSVIAVFNNLKLLELKISGIEKNISGHSDPQDLGKLQKQLDLHTELIREYTEKGGYEYESKTKSILESLGFLPETWEQKISTLSGGQRTRIGLIKLFLAEPDILLLDEPTNHVDVSSLEWLENYLKNYRKTVIIISHDRYFLDNVVTQIIEIENKKSFVYSGNYTSFVNKKAENREIRQKHFELQQREIQRIEEMIARLRAWGGKKKIIQAKSKEKMLGKMERVERPERLPGKVRLAFTEKKERISESGNDVLSVIELAKSFPPKKLFFNLSFEVKKRDNFFIIGANGTGKSTLLKILTNRQSPDYGRFYFGYNVRLGYYDQENQNLDPDSTVLDELWDDYADMDYGEVRNVLAAFLFMGDDIEKQVKVLSGGEKARLTIAKLILQKSNVLLLDEPTNHLDITSREALEAALLDFKGTIIAVSHDRYFMKKLSTRILELDPELMGGYIDYKDGYEEYINYKRSFLLKEGTAAPDLSEMKKKFENEEAKKLKRQKEQLEKEKRAAELEIKRVEKRMAELEFMIKDDEIEADFVKLNEIYEENIMLEEKLEELYEIFYNF